MKNQVQNFDKSLNYCYRMRKFEVLELTNKVEFRANGQTIFSFRTTSATQQAVAYVCMNIANHLNVSPDVNGVPANEEKKQKA